MILYSKGINFKIAIALVNSKCCLAKTGNSVISFDEINDKRKIVKVSSYILFTQRET